MTSSGVEVKVCHAFHPQLGVLGGGYGAYKKAVLCSVFYKNAEGFVVLGGDISKEVMGLLEAREVGGK